jgi:hypothetical protein
MNALAVIALAAAVASPVESFLRMRFSSTPPLREEASRRLKRDLRKR